MDQFENADMVRGETTKRHQPYRARQQGGEPTYYHMTINCVNNPSKDTIVGETGISQVKLPYESRDLSVMEPSQYGLGSAK